MSKETHCRHAVNLLCLELTRTCHTCLKDVFLGESGVSIVAQAPGQPRFAIVVDWLEKDSGQFVIQEDDREHLESTFRCPVFFALAIGPNCEVLRLEKALSAKLLSLEHAAKRGIEFFAESIYSRPLQYVVLELTYVRGEAVRIVLDRVENQFRVRAHWGEAGLVNGFDLRLDDIERLPLAQARRLPAILEMARVIRELAESDVWSEYSRGIQPFS